MTILNIKYYPFKIIIACLIIVLIKINECELKSVSDSNFVRNISNDDILTRLGRVDSGRPRLKFAVLLPWNASLSGGKEVAPAVLAAIHLAVKDLQKPGHILDPFDISIVYRDTNCSSATGPLAAFELYSSEKKPDAFFGPICDYVMAPVARYSSVWQIPVITAGGLADAFQYKSDQYSTLTRMLGGYGQVGVAIKGILAEFNWKIVSFVFHNHAVQKGKGNSDCHHTMAAIFRALNSSTSINRPFDEAEWTKEQYKQTVMSVKDISRIVIMCGNPTKIREIMLAADDLGMVDSGEYVFFNIELFSSISNQTLYPWYSSTDTPENNMKAKKAYSALLTVTAKQPDDKSYHEFSDQVKELAETKYNFTFQENEPVSTIVTAFYDSVLLFSHALNKSITESGDESLNLPINGANIVDLMRNYSFKGITGDVIINENGDRVSDYSLLDMNPDTGKFEIVANYFHDVGLKYVDGKSIHWAGGRTTHPPDTPKCGFDNTKCPDNSLPGYAILSIVLGFVVILMAIISIVGYRHYKLEAEINSMTWKVNWFDVLPCLPNSKHRNSIHSLGKRGSQVTIHSEDLGSLGGDKQLYIPIGFYKGNKVAIKRISVNGMNLNRDLMLQLKKMKDLQHDHLVRFYGACVDPPDSCILTEYCPKGSLQDILENDQIKLDMMFKLSLMHDISRGMHYLHSTDLNSHGALKSSNCVVDSRFVLKITDFGLHALRKNSGEEYEDDGSYAYWKKLLWTAPEILRMDSQPPQGTQKGDVYSFGIIVHEILSRQGPFYMGEEEKSPKEIIQLVKAQSKLFLPPYRPKLDETCYDDINSMMTRCWSEDPSERPDFSQLKTMIRKINKENESGNILDNLLKRMEMYANNLEFLVQERTQDYLEEKRKCEELLYQLLPKSVAAQLIMGQSVVAETYDQVTIYFSDIVGFTAISAESTPMEVVDLLNDLYTCFDSIVENFDVYKVETIGDAYMVVSGLPVRNGHLHAREIARLALALLKATYTFKIRHRPNEQLRLRIGLHSGPCVAGVVGLKMPRYCLFGDTVNTASRMESNGEPLKIHVSENTKLLLDEFGTFITTERGYTNMKGKGSMMTYWLNGEKQIPQMKSDLEATHNHLLPNNLQDPHQNEDDELSVVSATNGNLKNNLLMNNSDKKLNTSMYNNLNSIKMNNLSTTQPVTSPTVIASKNSNLNGPSSVISSADEKIIADGDSLDQQLKLLNNNTTDDREIHNCGFSSPLLVKN